MAHGVLTMCLLYSTLEPFPASKGVSTTHFTDEENETWRVNLLEGRVEIKDRGPQSLCPFQCILFPLFANPSLEGELIFMLCIC